MSKFAVCFDRRFYPLIERGFESLEDAKQFAKDLFEEEHQTEYDDDDFLYESHIYVCEIKDVIKLKTHD